MVDRPSRGTLELFDTQQLGLDGLCACYLLRGPTPVLIDAGTKASSAALVHWLRSLDAVPRYLVITHTHHDHIGAIEGILQAFGEERVSVVASRMAAEQLRDPNSVNRNYTLDRFAPTERVQVVGDGEVLELQDLRLQFFLTPGHTADSLSVLETGTGVLFLGDLPGDWLWGTTYLPPIASEDFDEAAYHRSMRRMMQLGARSIALPHFGVFKGEEGVRLLHDQLARYGQWRDAIVAAHEQRGATEDVALCIRELLRGSRFASLDGWDELVQAFAGWCVTGLQHAGVLRSWK